jgi:hypothetical protein
MTMSQGNFCLDIISRKILIRSKDLHMIFIDLEENMIPTVYLTSEKMPFHICMIDYEIIKIEGVFVQPLLKVHLSACHQQLIEVCVVGVGLCYFLRAWEGYLGS